MLVGLAKLVAPIMPFLSEELYQNLVCSVQPGAPESVESALVAAASYPNFAGKHAGEALFTAADFLAYLRQAGVRDDAPAPGGVVLCYQRSNIFSPRRLANVTICPKTCLSPHR